MDGTPKQEFRVRDLSTRSVTLFPTRAQVVRDIKNIVLKRGANEITVLGLSPSVDEDSIKVEGTGNAIISDIAVELLPNRDIFQDIYPDSDEDYVYETESDGEYEPPQKDSKALASIREKMTELRDEMDRCAEEISSAATRLKILDAHGMAQVGRFKEVKVDVAEGLDTYRVEREKVFQAHMEATVRKRKLDEEYADLKEEETTQIFREEREARAQNKAKAKEERARDKEKAKQRRREEEKRKEKERVRRERERFWPRSCWSVRITLDAVNTDTPASSRRSSIASASDLVKVAANSDTSTPERDYTVDLSLSYVVSNAYWSPSYDLSLSTTSNTAVLCFDAQLTNKTSENWANCKIVLSTSQATFAGLQDAIPTLVPWRVRLGKKGFQGAQGSVLDSREERAQKEGWKSQQHAWGAQKTRAHLYGVSSPSWREREDRGGRELGGNFDERRAVDAFPAASLPPPRFGAMQDARTSVVQTAPPGASLFASGGGLFGGMSNQQAIPPPPPPAAAAPASASRARGMFARQTQDSVEEEEVPRHESAGDYPDDDRTISNSAPELSFQETAFEETGLTTTYDLPGLKTLNTSSTASKQRVARISFSGVNFSHTVVAKYKPVAYLKAKLHNRSAITLLKGPVGLTLDGSFMGRSALPRCSAGDTFTLSLGVDPAIGVVYPNPDVKRSTSGIFTKEDSSVYTRSITLTNSRGSGKPVTLVVLDQVPVSEDERLKVAVTYPSGLRVGGGEVKTGVQGKGGKENSEWGRATARLKKGGEVAWDVQLNAGRSGKLVLEYEVAVPGGEGVVQV